MSKSNNLQITTLKIVVDQLLFHPPDCNETRCNYAPHNISAAGYFLKFYTNTFDQLRKDMDFLKNTLDHRSVAGVWEWPNNKISKVTEDDVESIVLGWPFSSLVTWCRLSQNLFNKNSVKYHRSLSVNKIQEDVNLNRKMTWRNS